MMATETEVINEDVAMVIHLEVPVQHETISKVIDRIEKTWGKPMSTFLFHVCVEIDLHVHHIHCNYWMIRYQRLDEDLVVEEDMLQHTFGDDNEERLGQIQQERQELFETFRERNKNDKTTDNIVDPAGYRCLLSTIHYIDRLSALVDLNPKRLPYYIAAAMYVSLKIHEEEVYFPDHAWWVKCMQPWFGQTPIELVKWERTFCKLLNYNLYIKPEEFDQLERRAEKLKQCSP